VYRNYNNLNHLISTINWQFVFDNLKPIVILDKFLQKLEIFVHLYSTIQNNNKKRNKFIKLKPWTTRGLITFIKLIKSSKNRLIQFLDECNIFK